MGSQEPPRTVKKGRHAAQATAAHGDGMSVNAGRGHCVVHIGDLCFFTLFLARGPSPTAHVRDIALQPAPWISARTAGAVCGAPPYQSVVDRGGAQMAAFQKKKPLANGTIWRN